MSTDILRKNYLLSGFTEDEFHTILEYITLERFEKDATIFVEHMQGESMFFIASGMVRVTRMVAEGAEKVLVDLASGNSFGELALVNGGVREVTVRVIEDADIYKLSRESFEGLFREHPHIAGSLLLVLLQRILSDIREILPTISEILARG
ncbi:MAG: cyclic nucleotide-binding domain-containing protein [Deltaproteobacteria bacterium]|nr:cyclic nucleotide-binding domain-containing protein [Candidatus Zymogenaceae bacterium]